MPSIRLTPLQPTSFDLWRDRVLTTPRRTLIREASMDRDAATGTFQTLAERLVGDEDAPTLATQIRDLTDAVKTLLADQRGHVPVSVGQSAVDIHTALSEQGPLVVALRDCVHAIDNLDMDDDDEEPGAPTEPGIPDERAMAVLRALDDLRDPLLDTDLSADEVNKSLMEWREDPDTQGAWEQLEALGEDWQKRFLALSDLLAGDAFGITPSARRERLGELMALEQDITHAWADGEDTSTVAQALPEVLAPPAQAKAARRTDRTLATTAAPRSAPKSASKSASRPAAKAAAKAPRSGRR
ncbi:hypothetical protein OU995_15205 [Roseateles sp. SL47]|uniref:hypothetical protein n=1 Tax=Roseateles sp. SL47 TaxID=2995138 RepID=UPI0022713CD8|nr:hypothetical protein [Roseateles sp. SL47]WAC70957.1 hypothetical protein OU995_15205 [Roseateles sp. SL47]